MNEEQLCWTLLGEVVHQWTTHESAVEIGSDVRKVEIMEAARHVLGKRGRNVPTEVADLYERVYLRDVWT